MQRNRTDTQGKAARNEVAQRIERAIETGDATPLRRFLLHNSGLPGPRLNLRVVNDVADAVAALVLGPDAPGDSLAELLDGWAALSVDEAPGDRPDVVLPCSAVLAYGAVGAARVDWWEHELAKVRRAANDPRWRVREIVALALQRLLAADWGRTVASLRDWAGSADPLVVRAAAAGVAEPRLLDEPDRAAEALAVQGLAIDALLAQPSSARRSEKVRALRKGLGFTVSVAVAATGNFEPLEAMVASGDPDLIWVAEENMKKSRLRRWPNELARMRTMLGAQ